MHKSLRSLLILALMASAALALAADEEPKASEPKIEVGTEQPAPESVAKPRLNAEELALQAIKDSGRETVAALVAQLPGQATEQARADIQKQIEAAKLNSRIEMLNKIIEFAVAKGDKDTATEPRRILDIMQNGPKSLPQSVNRPAPTQNQGGQR